MRRLIGSLVRPPLRLVRRIFFRLAALMPRLRLVPWLYYSLFSLEFIREKHAVLQGIGRFRRGRDGDGWFLLRRYVHRIEKGLSMRARRRLFAADYSGRAVDLYLSLRRECGDPAARAELQWAGNVLQLYFESIDVPPALAGARQRLMEVLAADAGPRGSEPFPAGRRAPCRVANEDFAALCRRRRSVRWFSREPVPRELIDRAVGDAIQAPSACNRQPFHFVVVTEPGAVARIAAIPGGANGYSENIPCLIAVIGDLAAFEYEKDRHLIYIDSSLATMGLLLSLETLGLSSCVINFPDAAAFHRKAAKALGLQACQVPVMFVAVGFPDPAGMVPFSEKKPLDLARRYL